MRQQDRWTRSAAVTMLVMCLVATSGCTVGSQRTAIDPAPELLMRRVADRVLADYPSPPPFDWGEGVMMAGMMRAGVSLDESRYIDFVRGWADYWYRQGLARVLAGDPKDRLRKYCGHWGPGYPVVLLYERTGERVYVDMALQIADFVTTQATRTSDDGLGHWGGNHQLWVDTLYMVCPLFAQLNRLDGRADLLHEAARQLGIFARHTQDPKTGLFWHMYDDDRKQTAGALWGRGNGWVAMSYAQVLEQLDRRSTEYAELSNDFRRQCRALLAVQDRQSCLWHTVLDRPDSYAETSASAMILASLLQARRLGICHDVSPQFIERSWRALSAKVDPVGRVLDVSGGTSPDKAEVYAAKPRGTYTWGTGAFLMAAAELR